MQDEPMELNDDELDHVTGGTAVNTGRVNGVGTGGVSPVDLSSMDIETALMMVQSERTKILDAQLQSQVDAVKQRNETIFEYNNLINLFKDAKMDLASKEATAAADGKPREHDFTLSLDDKLGEKSVREHLEAEGLLDRADKDKSGSLTQDEIDGAVEILKSRVDSMQNSQQMDMLRLQSMSNKRNEAFDVMTNFIKKMQDNRSSIIGNMR